MTLLTLSPVIIFSIAAISGLGCVVRAYLNLSDLGKKRMPRLIFYGSFAKEENFTPLGWSYWKRSLIWGWGGWLLAALIGLLVW